MFQLHLCPTQIVHKLYFPPISVPFIFWQSVKMKGNMQRIPGGFSLFTVDEDYLYMKKAAPYARSIQYWKQRFLICGWLIAACSLAVAIRMQASTAESLKTMYSKTVVSSIDDYAEIKWFLKHVSRGASLVDLKSDVGFTPALFVTTSCFHC